MVATWSPASARNRVGWNCRRIGSATPRHSFSEPRRDRPRLGVVVHDFLAPHELEPDRLRKLHGFRRARDRVQPMRYTVRIPRADDDDRTVQGHSYRRRVATPAHSGAIPGDALSWHGAAGELCAASRKAAWHIFMCRMRSTAVPIEIEIRERHRVAKLQ